MPLELDLKRLERHLAAVDPIASVLLHAEENVVAPAAVFGVLRFGEHHLEDGLGEAHRENEEDDEHEHAVDERREVDLRIFVQTSEEVRIHLSSSFPSVHGGRFVVGGVQLGAAVRRRAPDDAEASAGFKRTVAVFDRFDVKSSELEHDVVVGHQGRNRDGEPHDGRDERRPDAGGKNGGIGVELMPSFYIVMG